MAAGGTITCSRRILFGRKSIAIAFTKHVAAPGVEEIVDALSTEVVNVSRETTIEAYGPEIVGAPNVGLPPCRGMVRRHPKPECGAVDLIAMVVRRHHKSSISFTSHLGVRSCNAGRRLSKIA